MEGEGERDNDEEDDRVGQQGGHVGKSSSVLLIGVIEAAAHH